VEDLEESPRRALVQRRHQKMSRWHDLRMRVGVRRAGYHRHQLVVGGRVKRTYPSHVQALRAGAKLVASKRSAPRSSKRK